MNIDELAEYLKLPKETLYKYARRGEIPARKAGRQWEFAKEEVDAWMAKRANVEPAAPRIMVVDDDAGVRGVLVAMLRRGGYAETATAGDGQEALERLRRSPYDLVFLDLKMPGMNGVEVLREIRRMPAAPAVVIVTGYYDGALMDEVLALGPVEVLRKPVSAETLLLAAKSHSRRGHD